MSNKRTAENPRPQPVLPPPLLCSASILGDELDQVGEGCTAGGGRAAFIPLGLSHQWCLPPARAWSKEEELLVGVFLALSLRGLVIPLFLPSMIPRCV